MGEVMTHEEHAKCVGAIITNLLCLSEIKLAHTDDEVRQEMA
jgi:hypothetical protein